MSEITLQYGSNEILWSNVAELPEVTDNVLRCIDADNTIIILRTFATQDLAVAARVKLLDLVDGGGVTIIVIDDL